MSQRHQKTLLLVILALGGTLVLLAEDDATSTSGRSGAKHVVTAEARPARAERDLRFSGVTRAAREAQLSFTASGRMRERLVDTGDVVRAGQVLARLEVEASENAAAVARAGLAELETRRAQAERDRERVTRLVDAKAATDEELERAEAALEALEASVASARARLAEAERTLGETTLVAPFDGTVTEVFLEPGEQASPGRAVLDLAGDGDVELRVEVPESVVLDVRPGDAAEVILPLADRRVPATVRSVARSASGSSRLFPVVARLEGDALAGMTAELVLRLETDAALAVPVEAVVNPGGRRAFVFRVRSGPPGETTAEKVSVDVEGLDGDHVVVSSADLRAGDAVVVGGQRGLLDGEPVQVDASTDDGGTER